MEYPGGRERKGLGLLKRIIPVRVKKNHEPGRRGADIDCKRRPVERKKRKMDDN